MSSFNCQTCQAPHTDTEHGYISGCVCDGIYGRTCDVCRQEMKLLNPDGWLRCEACWEKYACQKHHPDDWNN